MFEQDYKRFAHSIYPSKDLILRTAAKMQNASMQKSKPAGHLKGTLVLVALILLGLIGATAVALTPARLIDWRGNIKEGIPPLNDTMFDTAQLLLADAPDDAFWIVEIGKDKATAHYPIQKIDSFEDLKQQVKSTAPDLMLPSTLPDGFEFGYAQLHFYPSRETRDVGLTLIDSESYPGDIVLKKFKVPTSITSNISGYDIGFVNDTGNGFSISCSREDASGGSYFSIREGYDYEQLSIDGFKHVIYAYNNASSSATMHVQQTLNPPSVYYHWNSLYSQNPEDSEMIKPRLFDAAHYRIDSNHLSKDQLIKLAQSLK